MYTNSTSVSFDFYQKKIKNQGTSETLAPVVRLSYKVYKFES